MTTPPTFLLHVDDPFSSGVPLGHLLSLFPFLALGSVGEVLALGDQLIPTAFFCSGDFLPRSWSPQRAPGVTSLVQAVGEPDGVLLTSLGINVGYR